MPPQMRHPCYSCAEYPWGGPLLVLIMVLMVAVIVMWAWRDGR